MTLTEQWRRRFGHLTVERLERASAKAARDTRVAAMLAAVCVLAGVWLDWRWLPTAVIPATWAAIKCAASALLGQLAAEKAKADR